MSRYALGRDYHKVLRNALQGLADDIVERVGPMGYRVFVDSGPVLEKALARNAGLGWIGKHTNLIARDAGSYFFIGEILTDLPLPVDEAASAHCGTCSRVYSRLPHRRDHRALSARCAPLHLLSHHRAARRDPGGAAPHDGQPHLRLRRLPAGVPVEQVRARRRASGFQGAARARCVAPERLFAWTEAEFLERTEGSAIRRIGYERWLRNIAVALGNAPSTPENLAALAARADDPSELVREHVRWALAEHAARRAPAATT